MYKKIASLILAHSVLFIFIYKENSKHIDYLEFMEYSKYHEYSYFTDLNIILHEFDELDEEFDLYYEEEEEYFDDSELMRIINYINPFGTTDYLKELEFDTKELEYDTNLDYQEYSSNYIKNDFVTSQ